MPPPAWQIRPILPAGGLVGLYGAPGSYKSFIAIDMAMSVATGRPWHGHEVQQGFALYVSAEGGAGIGKRVGAWLHHHQVEPKAAHMAWLIEPFPVSPNANELRLLFQRIDEVNETPALVIIDTLARCFDGDENMQEDMGLFVKGVDRLRHELGATVIVVHHTRLDGERERGNTAFRGAADAMISLKRRNRDTSLKLSCDKQKDAEEFQPLSLHMVTVNPSTEDSDRASCVVEMEEPVEDSEDGGPLASNALMDQIQKDIATGTTNWTKDQLQALVPNKRSSFFALLADVKKRGLIVYNKDSRRYEVVQ
jgi:hypothetical protein